MKANGSDLYMNSAFKKIEQEQNAKEHQRLEEIGKLEKENEIKDILSSLQ